jgi:hypothetical protein
MVNHNSVVCFARGVLLMANPISELAGWIYNEVQVVDIFMMAGDGE